MTQKRRFLKTLGVAIIFTISTPGNVDVALGTGSDLPVPPWSEEPQATLQEWWFDTPDMQPPPDVLNNPAGDPTINITSHPSVEWLPTYEHATGVWQLSGWIDVGIPNFPEPNPDKLVWVGIIWRQDTTGVNPLEIAASIDDIEWIPGVTVFEEIDLNGWYHSAIQIELHPNPDFEMVHISGDVMVDALGIYTWCIPEPATLSLLTIGGLVLLRGRKR